MYDLLSPWLTPAAIIFAALAIGWIIDRLVLGRLLSFARRSAWQFDDLLLGSIRGVSWIWVLLVGVRIAMAAMPSLDPQTLHLAANAVAILFIVSVTAAVLRFSTRCFTAYAASLPLGNGSTIFRYLLNAVICIIAALVALDSLGIAIGPVLGALGVGGLAVALALQDTLANLFAGMHILMARQLRVGDFIVIEGGHEGTVVDVGWRNTSIRTGTQNLVVIPNAKLAGSVLVNRHLPDQTQHLTIELQVAYDSNLDQVEQVLLDEGRRFVAEFPGCEASDTLPVVRFTAFADSGIDTRLIVRVKDVDAFFLGRHELLKRLHRRLRDAGITIPFPTRTLQISGPAPQPAT